MTKVTRQLEPWSGISNLLGVDDETLGYNNSKEIDINLIEVPLQQSRKYFDEDKLNALANNIKENGILQPILVRSHPTSSGKYELISGERRLRATKIAQLTTIPIILQECDDKKAKNIQLWENLSREQLNTWEETRAIMDILMSVLDMSQDEVTSLLFQITNVTDGKITHNVMRNSETKLILDFFGQTPMTCESYRKNRLPLLSLPDDITEYLATGKIEYTKLLIIKRVSDDSIREELLQKTFEENLSLTQVKEIVAQIQTSASEKSPKEPTLIDRYDSIRSRLRKVHKNISPKSHKEIYKLINQFENVVAKVEAEAESEVENTVQAE